MRLDRRGLVSILLAALSVQALAQDRVTLLREAVDPFKQAVEKDHIRGAVLYVAERGKPVLFEAVGYRHFESRAPMEKDTLFRMASNTKPVVATAILMLQDDGRLSVDDTVAKHLTSFDNNKSRRITIAQLLSHSSGLRIEPVFYPFKRGDEISLPAAVAKFAAEGPKAAPGAYSYSNAGYNTLGAIIEVVSGMPLETFLSTRIYEPLGMTDTLHHADPAKLDRMATVYRGRPRGATVEFTRSWTPGDPPDYPIVRASGGMITTAADYAKFLEMLRQKGMFNGKRLLKAETVQAMITPRVKTGQAGWWYGYGWMIAAGGVFTHAGSDGTMAWVDPSREIIGMVLTQSPGGINPVGEFPRKISAALAGR
jgi:CubicO group peptidase (beta-lactamase class C family)